MMLALIGVLATLLTLEQQPASTANKQAVVATGRMQGEVFVAEEILAKHDENYMPKEVADKMGMAHRKHDVAAPGGAAPTSQEAK